MNTTRGWRHILGLMIATAIVTVTFAGPAGATGGGKVTEFPIPDSGSVEGIAVGGDGGLWFTDSSPSISRIDPVTKKITSHSTLGLSAPITNPQAVAADADGLLWFVGNGQAVGRLNPFTRRVTSYPSSSLSSSLHGIALGPDGGMWFTDLANNRIGRIDPKTKVITTKATGNPNIAGPWAIAAGPDNAMWFTTRAIPGSQTGTIGRIDVATRDITTFTIPVDVLAASPRYIALGPDDAMWFTDDANEELWKVDVTTPTPTMTHFDVPSTGDSNPWGIAAGPDNSMWYVERSTNNPEVGRINVTTKKFTSQPLNDFEPEKCIVAGPDGAMWFTDDANNSFIGRVTTNVTPKISGFTPASGPAGTTVTITGQNLGSAITVAFNGKPAVATSNTATQIVVAVPSGATSGRITVTTAAGTATSSMKFTVS